MDDAEQVSTQPGRQDAAGPMHGVRGRKDGRHELATDEIAAGDDGACAIAGSGTEVHS